MGLGSNVSSRSGEYLDGMISDYVGRKGRVRPNKNFSTCLVTSLTCLQFAFAIYATFLLYFMIPTVDLKTGPDSQKQEPQNHILLTFIKSIFSANS